MTYVNRCRNVVLVVSRPRSFGVGTSLKEERDRSRSVTIVVLAGLGASTAWVWVGGGCRRRRRRRRRRCCRSRAVVAAVGTGARRESGGIGATGASSPPFSDISSSGLLQVKLEGHTNTSAGAEKEDE